jgi:putative transposase
VTKQLGLLGFDGKLWQRNYDEHIIRDEESYYAISDYIRKNPAQWGKDKFFSR